MSQKVKVPDGMLKAAISKQAWTPTGEEDVKEALEAALGWLAENPIVPTDEQINQLWEHWAMPLDHSAKGLGVYGPLRDQICSTSTEWQRRMFLSPDPEVPEAIKDLLVVNCDGNDHAIKKAILEAYRRGLKERK